MGLQLSLNLLFRKLHPNKAYFGEKDFQQLQIIRALNSQLDLQIEIIGCPIIREDDGLAMSSRNSLLSPAQRKSARLLSSKHFRKLLPTKKSGIFPKWKPTSGDPLKRNSQLKVEYFFVAKTSNLIPVKQIEKEKFHIEYL